jgi:hypothetical protein
MNKAVRFVLMLALVALAAWTSTPKAAYALPLCNSLNGHACFRANQKQACADGYCSCDPGTLTWDCF